MGRVAQLLAVGYVMAVAVLVGVSFREPGQGFSVTEGVGFALTLPVLLAALPIVYAVGAATWWITDAGDGGPMWPVTLVFVMMFTGIAVANVWVLHRLSRRRARRRRAALARP